MIINSEEYVEKFLNWLVQLDVAHYRTESLPDYTPSGESHFYLKGSQERFTSKQIIEIFGNHANDETMENWNYAIAEHAEWKKRNGK